MRPQPDTKHFWQLNNSKSNRNEHTNLLSNSKMSALKTYIQVTLCKLSSFYLCTLECTYYTYIFVRSFWTKRPVIWEITCGVMLEGRGKKVKRGYYNLKNIFYKEFITVKHKHWKNHTFSSETKCYYVPQISFSCWFLFYLHGNTGFPLSLRSGGQRFFWQFLCITMNWWISKQNFYQTLLWITFSNWENIPTVFSWFENIKF